MQKVPIDRVRDVLYNIEQFKGDALKLPDIKTTMGKKGTDRANAFSAGKTSKDGGEASGPVYGAGSQSAGSIGGGDSTSKGASKMLGNGNQG